MITRRIFIDQVVNPREVCDLPKVPQPVCPTPSTVLESLFVMTVEFSVSIEMIIVYVS